jgi:hypothetical protein
MAEIQNPWLAEHWNMTAQSAFIQQHGRPKADEFAKAAGSFVGATAPAKRDRVVHTTIIKPTRNLDINQNRDVRTVGANAPDDGDVLTFDASALPAPGQWVPMAPTGGGGGAPVSAQYLTLALNGTLSAERRFVPRAGLEATDGGVNADYTLDLATGLIDYFHDEGDGPVAVTVEEFHKNITFRVSDGAPVPTTDFDIVFPVSQARAFFCVINETSVNLGILKTGYSSGLEIGPFETIVVLDDGIKLRQIGRTEAIESHIPGTPGNFVGISSTNFLEDSGFDVTDFAAAAHAHSAADITSGLLALTRGGTNADLDAAVALNIIRVNAAGTALEDSGFDVTDFAATAHAHSAADITSGLLALARGGTNADLGAGTPLNLIRLNAGGTALEDAGFDTGDFLTPAAADAVYLRLDTANDPMQADLDMGGFALKNTGLVEGGGAVAGFLALAPDDTTTISAGGLRGVAVDPFFTANNGGSWVGISSLSVVPSVYTADGTTGACVFAVLTFGVTSGAGSTILLSNTDINPCAGTLFNHGQRYRSESAGQIVAAFTLLDTPSFDSVGATAALAAQYRGVYTAPRFTASAGGTGTTSTCDHFTALLSTDVGWTIPDRRGFYYRQALGTGAVTDEAALYIGGFAATGNRYTLYSPDTTGVMLHAGSVRIGAAPATLDTLNVDGSSFLEHVAVEDDDYAFGIECRAAGLGDVKALGIHYVTGALAAGERGAAVLVGVDGTTAAGGAIAGLTVVATETAATAVVGLAVGALVGPIFQFSGTFADADSILNNAADVLAALSTGGAGNISVFVADNDTVTIGFASEFEEIEIIVDTPSSGGGIAPTFEFSTGVGTWATFSPTDGTNGLRNTGVIVWRESDIPSWAVGVGAEFLIRITRTRNSLTTTPIIDKVQVSATVKYMWDATGSVVINKLESTIVTGTPPFVVASTTKVDNLNVDLLDNETGAYYLDSANFTGTEWDDLTDGLGTTLHTHVHANLTSLIAPADDHTQYIYWPGRAGGQTAKGGTAPADFLKLQSTSGAGSGDYIAMLGGTDGATEIARFLGSGKVGIGTTTAANASSFEVATTTTALVAGTYAGSYMGQTWAPSGAITGSPDVITFRTRATYEDGNVNSTTGQIRGFQVIAEHLGDSSIAGVQGAQLFAIVGPLAGAESGTSFATDVVGIILQSVANADMGAAATPMSTRVIGGAFAADNRGRGTVGTMAPGTFSIGCQDANSIITNAFGIRVAGIVLQGALAGIDILTAGTITNGTMVEIGDWSSGPTYTNQPVQLKLLAASVAGRIGIYQDGTNAYNKFEGSTTLGADDVPTTGFAADVRGDLRVSGYVDITAASAVAPRLSASFTSTNTSGTRRTALLTAFMDPSAPTSETLAALIATSASTAGDTNALSGTIYGAQFASQHLSTALLTTLYGTHVTTSLGQDTGAETAASSATNVGGITSVCVGNADMGAAATLMATRMYGVGSFCTNIGRGTVTTFAAGHFGIGIQDANAIIATAYAARFSGLNAADGNTLTAGTITNGSFVEIGDWVAGPTYTNQPVQLKLVAATVAGRIGIYQDGTNAYNKFEGKTGLGIDAVPDAWAELGAATATIAPLKFNSAALIASPLRGCVEFLTDDYYGTITTGDARKKFVLDNGVDLVSGRVPFATTNGRLVDDADMTFSGATLTVTGVAVGATGLTSTGLIKSSSASAGVGYAAGAGSTVTQLTSKATTVIINALCGTITTHNAALANNAQVTFTVTNSSMAATDVVILNHQSGGTLGVYIISAGGAAAGSFTITLGNESGASLSEALVLRFAIIKAVAA